LVKAVTYRICVTIIAFLIAYWATESVEKSIQVIVMYLAGSMIIYYIHERIYANFIKWGLEDDNNECNERKTQNA